MGILYELIKEDIEKLNEYRKLEVEDFDKSKTFNALFEVEAHRHKVNKLLDSVSLMIRKNKSDKDFEKIMDKYEGVRKDINITPVRYSYEYKLNPILDYETLLNHVEESVSKDIIDKIINDYNASKDYIKPVKKPLEPYVKDIITDMNNIKGMSQDERDTATKYLNYVKDMLVEKQNNNMDKLIDLVSQKRNAIADGKLESWANKNGIDGYKAGVYDGKHEHVITISNSSKQEKELFKPVLDMKVKYSDEYKNKILNLEKFLNDKSVLAEAQAGETGFKEYGFMAYFNSASKINKLVDNQLKLNTDKEKVENLYKICAEANKLQKIEKEYEDILSYIKDNFNLDDVSLSTNIYSGRQTSFSGNLSAFKPTLPEKWDNENAPYGVILNGFIQLKALAFAANTTIEDILNDPIGEFISGAKYNLDKLTDDNSIKVNEASLGKRMANTLVLSRMFYTPTFDYLTSIRGIEFINNQCEENEQNYDNICATSIGVTYAKNFFMESTTLFGSGVDTDIDSLKNLFAFGNDIDNLFSLSNNYPHDLNKKGVIGSAYNAQVKSRGILNPVRECRNILETCKDFYNEYKVLLNKNPNNDCNINPGAIILAGKEYFKDFLLKNNINPLDIKDDKERKEVLDFLKEPFDVFKNKYENNSDFISKKGERGLHKMSELEYSFKECQHEKYERNIEYFTNRISQNVLNTGNANKNVSEMLEANKGGYLERKFGTTSKEYSALRDAVEASLDEYSSSYGDFSMPKYYAEKYLAYKLPEGTNFDNLKPNEKRRVEFCRSIIKTCNEIDNRNKRLDEAKKAEELRLKEEREKESFENKEIKYKEILIEHEKEKEYSYSDNVKLQEKVMENKARELNFEEQIKKDSNDSIISNNFEIPEESEIGNLEVNK